MKFEVLPCSYTQGDSKVQQIVDLKLEYCLSNNAFIKSIIEDVDGLIIFRVGSVDAIRQRIEAKKNISEEERKFLEEVRAIIY